MDTQTFAFLHENNQRYRALVERSFFCVYLIDFEGNILDANDAVLTLLGYHREDIPQHTIASLVAEDQVPLAFQLIDEIRQNGEQQSPVELKVKKKNGEYAWFEVEASLIHRNGHPYAVQGIARDITAYKATEQMLKESENRYRSIFENTGTAIIIIEEDTTISMMNRPCQKLTGYSKEEVEGKKSWTAFIVKEELERLREYHRLRRIDPSSVPETYESRLIDKHGTVKDIIVMASMIPGTKQSIVALVDVTDRKQAEAALKERERELESRSQTLQELNTALKVLLKNREEDKALLEERVLMNVKELITPYIEKLKNAGLEEKDKALVTIIESNIGAIISPFAQSLTSLHINLTPTEIKIANLIKQGKTSKEMKELLECSYDVVLFHRSNIRKKLGLLGKKVNLKSYLQAKT